MNPNIEPQDVPGIPELLADIMAGPDFATVEEVAAMLRVSKMTVYRNVHEGKLACIRVGRSFRVPRQSLAAYVQNSMI